MKCFLTRYNHDMSWTKDYDFDYEIWDRSEVPMEGARVVPNIGSDLYDKLCWIIENYDNLPDIVILAKANLFKYISKREFDEVKDNKTFTPLVTKYHEEVPGFSFYSEDGMYNEKNNGWYLIELPPENIKVANVLGEWLGFYGKKYLKFAPGANYILPKENILQHPKEFYQKLAKTCEWTRYPGESQMIERGFYELFKL